MQPCLVNYIRTYHSWFPQLGLPRPPRQCFFRFFYLPTVTTSYLSTYLVLEPRSKINVFPILTNCSTLPCRIASKACDTWRDCLRCQVAAQSREDKWT